MYIILHFIYLCFFELFVELCYYDSHSYGEKHQSRQHYLYAKSI
jgi:hypothetical protein